MLTTILFLPLVGALIVLAIPRRHDVALKAVAIGTAGTTFALVVAAWVRFEPGAGFDLVERARWIPTIGAGYAVGVDGFSLPLIALTGFLFLAALIYSVKVEDRPKEYLFLFLFLEMASLGVFLSLDLFLFYVFWDLQLVAMYFVIAGWGHGDRVRSALKFFLYTLVGSLALLLGILGVYLNTSPRTLDMVEIVRQQPLAGGGALAVLVWIAFAIGFGVKTPVVPFHTWLPPAHVNAPAAGSTILAGVLLKMGTYGFVRIMMPMLPDTFRRFAWILAAVALVSIIYGALVALAQTDFKRMVAYTSVNHMGYVILGVAAAGTVAAGEEASRTLALDGAVYQMVSHGLITGALFLMAGVLWERRGTYDMGSYGGLARLAPVFSGLLGIAAFGSLGLPGLSGFVAEVQVFLGSFALYPVVTAVALLGILITAALMLLALQRLLLGRPPSVQAGFADLDGRERWSIGLLVALVVVLGVFPAWMLDVIEPSSRALVGLVG